MALSRRFVAAVLIALVLLLALARLKTYNEPLERDLATYAVIGQELNRGRLLYTDLWDHKPPGIYVAYAAGLAVAGDFELGIYLINVLSAACALLGIWAAARALAGEAAGLFAAACWAVTSGDLALQANQPNTELFVNAGVSGCFAFWFRLRDDALDLPSVLAAGALLATASIFKPVAVPFGAGIAAAHLLSAWLDGRSLRRAAAQAGVLAGAGAVCWAAVTAYFASQGRFRDFWDAVIDYNRSYPTSLFRNLYRGLSPRRLFPVELRAGLPMLTLAGLGTVLSGVRRPSRGALLLLAWLVSAPVAVSAPGFFFPHYYQLWLPPLCVGAAWGLARLAEAAGERGPAVFRRAGALVLAVLVLTEAPQYFLDAPEWSDKKYGGHFVRTKVAAEAAAVLLAPGETLFQWDSEPGLYLYAKVPPPSGVLWHRHATLGPMAGELSERILREVQAAPPELVVITRELPFPEGHPVTQWILDSYGPVPDRADVLPYRFWARKGGALEARLREAGGKTKEAER